MMQLLVLSSQSLYFIIYLLQSSTCFEHNMLIIRRLNCIEAASGIVFPVTLFYNIFITILYMFRALYAPHQEVELY